MLDYKSERKKGELSAVRDFIFHLFAIAIILSGLMIAGYSTGADELVFHNGDRRYGAVTELSDGTIILDAGGIIKNYMKSQVKVINMGVDEAGGIGASTAPIILNVTAPITHRTKVKTSSGKELRLDVEDGFDVPIIQLFPTRLPFYNRRGSFMAGLLVNSSTKTWHSLTLRAHLYDQQDKILTSKDFYIFRIPAATDNTKGQRKFEINFPDVPYERVDRVRVVRKF